VWLHTSVCYKPWDNHSVFVFTVLRESDGVFDLMWEVVPVCRGRYDDRVFFFEIDYGWSKKKINF